MNCQIQFSRKNKQKLINLPSAESAHSMVSVNLHQNICCFAVPLRFSILHSVRAGYGK